MPTHSGQIKLQRQAQLTQARLSHRFIDWKRTDFPDYMAAIITSCDGGSAGPPSTWTYALHDFQNRYWLTNVPVNALAGSAWLHYAQLGVGSIVLVNLTTRVPQIELPIASRIPFTWFKTSDLAITYQGGLVKWRQLSLTVADLNITLTAGATKYVWIALDVVGLPTTATITSGTAYPSEITWPMRRFWPLGSITTNATTISAYSMSWWGGDIVWPMPDVFSVILVKDGGVEGGDGGTGCTWTYTVKDLKNNTLATEASPDNANLRIDGVGYGAATDGIAWFDDSGAIKFAVLDEWAIPTDQDVLIADPAVDPNPDVTGCYHTIKKTLHIIQASDPEELVITPTPPPPEGDDDIDIVIPMGSGYSLVLSATGGTAPYVFTCIGDLPSGLTFTNGTFSGTPAECGSFSLVFVVTDANGATYSRPFVLVIMCASTFRLFPDGASVDGHTTMRPAGIAVSLPIYTTASRPPYTWSVTSGSLPTGMVLTNVMTGPDWENTIAATLSGTPVAGLYTASIKAIDADGAIGTYSNWHFQIAPLITVVAPCAAGIKGLPYSCQLTATGGTGPYQFSLSTATPLPPGLGMTSAGLIAGTCSIAGHYVFGVAAIDATGFRSAYRMIAIYIESI